MGWAVIVIKQGYEDNAEKLITGAGFNVFVPRFVKVLHGIHLENGRRKRTRHSGDLVMRPLFAGYGFAELAPDDDTHAIVTTPGVVGLLRQGRRLLPDQLIEYWRNRVDRGDFDEQPRPKVGDMIAIENDDFQQLTGELIATDDRGRKRALIQIFNRLSVPATLSSTITINRA